MYKYKYKYTYQRVVARPSFRSHEDDRVCRDHFVVTVPAQDAGQTSDPCRVDLAILGLHSTRIEHEGDQSHLSRRVRLGVERGVLLVRALALT